MKELSDYYGKDVICWLWGYVHDDGCLLVIVDFEQYERRSGYMLTSDLKLLSSYLNEVFLRGNSDYQTSIWTPVR